MLSTVIQGELTGRQSTGLRCNFSWVYNAPLESSNNIHIRLSISRDFYIEIKMSNGYNDYVKIQLTKLKKTKEYGRKTILLWPTWEQRHSAEKA